MIRIVWRLDSKPTRPPGPRRRPQAGLRLALLSLATVILLLGAVIAGVFCYETIGHGPAHGGSAGTETDAGARQHPGAQVAMWPGGNAAEHATYVARDSGERDSPG